jgi:hypothetical protein
VDVDISGESTRLKTNDYGFNIPDGVTIDGIEVSIDRYAEGGLNTIEDREVKIIKGGVVQSANEASTERWPQESEVKTYGDSLNKWGTTWTSSDINSSDFGVALSVLNNATANARTAYVDYISVTVYYTDIEAPTIAAHDNETTFEATSTEGALVEYTMPTATDNIDEAVEVVCDPASGSQFPIGKTTVNCTATDAANNSSKSEFVVTVEDTTPPVLELIGDAEIYVEYGADYQDQGATCTDYVDTPLEVTVGGDIVDTNNVGDSYEIVYTCTDSSNNSADQLTRIVNIVPRKVTVTADDVTKVYGETIPSNSELTYQVSHQDGLDGLIGDDTLSGELDAEISAPDAGTYDILQGTLSDPKYEIVSFEKGFLTITPAPLTITAGAKSKTAGDKDPALTYTVSGSLFYGDTLTGKLARPAGETAGTYLINQGTLSAGSNYEITFVGAIFTINKAPVVAAASTTTNNVIPFIPTTTETDTESDVLGTQTTDNDNTGSDSSTETTKKPVDNNFFNWTLFGIYDWVWLIMLAAAGSWWFFARRRDSEK